ncbi:MAG: hypothetical protein SGI71_12760 [Verrucomicrobiota bacterium]|nr:hypothetical protein [Verrucomicrobiota bacterium]
MNKNQFTILNVLAALFLVIVLANVAMSLKLRRSAVAIEEKNRGLMEAEAKFKSAQQSRMFLRQVAMRLAQGSDADPALRDLLVKHNLKVELNVNGKTKNYP